MEEEKLQVATKPSRREPSGTVDLESEDGRSWLSHGIAALAISALGLAVAGSVVLTTNAQTTVSVVAPQTVATQITAQRGTQQTKGQPATGQAPSAARTTRAEALAAFSQRSGTLDDPSRDDVRDAIVEERAAQRSEDLTKSAEQTAEEAVKAGSRARAEKLAASDLERRQAAVKLAQERSRKAIQERVAAEVRCELAARNTTNADPAETTPPDPANTGSTESADCDTTETSTDTSTDTSADPVPSGGGGAASPVPGAIVGASFGATGAWARYHTGLDFRAGFGTPIRAVTSGQVTYAGSKGNWAGNFVVIKHADGYSTLSAHMQSISVRVGQSVSASTVIGYVGSTGRSFGAHLHFETYPPGTTPGNVYTATNPINWLRAKGVDTN